MCIVFLAGRIRWAYLSSGVLDIWLLHALHRHYSSTELDVAHQLLPGSISRHHQHCLRHEPTVPRVSGYRFADILSLQEPEDFPQWYAHSWPDRSGRQHRAHVHCHIYNALADGHRFVAQAKQAISFNGVQRELNAPSSWWVTDALVFIFYSM